MFAVPFSALIFVGILDCLFNVKKLLTLLLSEIFLEQEALELHQDRLDAVG